MSKLKQNTGFPKLDALLQRKEDLSSEVADSQKQISEYLKEILHEIERLGFDIAYFKLQNEGIRIESPEKLKYISEVICESRTEASKLMQEKLSKLPKDFFNK